MNFRLAVAAAAFALAACQPAESPAQETAQPATQTAAAPVTGCDASRTFTWPSDLTATGTVSGPDCAKAIALLVVRNKAGEPLLVWSSRATDVFGLYDKTDAAGVKEGMVEWLDQRSDTAKTSATLPEWKAGAESPGDQASEFPFHADEWLDRDAYEAIRKAALPIFEFAQGHESSAVYILRDGQLESVGVQQFPG